MASLRRLLPWLAVVFYAGLLVLSLSAGWTGADPDTRWGQLRLAVFALGAAGLLGTACLHLIRALDRRALLRRQHLHKAKVGLEDAPPTSRPEGVSPGASDRSHAWPDRRWVATTAVALTVIVIGGIYLGLVSVWHWTEWPATTTGYATLGEAFAQGRTYVAVDPATVDINLSYYEGRYYLYWGPVPAAALAVLRVLGLPPLGDEVVVFVAVSLVFVFSCLIVLRMRHVYFEKLPLWLVVAALVTVGAIHPMLWFQNSPSLATAAIACGQSFLVGGVYFMVKAFTERHPAPGSYAAAGLLWGLAIASRATTGASVIVLVSGVALLSWMRSSRVLGHRKAAANLALLVTPLVLLLGLYGWYNAVRFDNPLETGLRYATYNAIRFGYPSETGSGSGPSATDRDDEAPKGTMFSLRYLVPNALYHLLAPLRPISRFPYLRAIYVEYTPFNVLLPRLGVPGVYGTEDAAGLLFAAPTLLFVATFARRWVYGGIPRQKPGDSPLAKAAGWTSIDHGSLGMLLILAGLAGLLPVMLLYFSTIRYEMDFVPLLALVSVLGMWRFHEDSRPFPIQSRLADGAIVLLVTVSTLASLLLAVSGAGSRFDDANPDLFSLLVGILPHW